jgi:hypothetical protein
MADVDLYHLATRIWAAGREQWTDETREQFDSMLDRLREVHGATELRILWGAPGEVAGVVAYFTTRPWEAERGAILAATARILERLEAEPADGAAE